MKKAAVLLAIAYVGSLGAPASAQSQYNGELSFELYYNSGENTQDGSQTLGYIHSRSNFDFSNNFGAQIDIGAGRIFGNSTEGSAGVHVYYNRNSNLSFGGFYNQEGYLTNQLGASGTEISHYGLEVAYTGQRVRLEGYAGQLDFEAGRDRQLLGIDAEMPIHAVNGLTAIGGLHGTTTNSDDVYWYVGAEKELTGATSLGARYSRDDEENVFGLFLDYRFGSGAKYKSRGFSSAMRGDIN